MKIERIATVDGAVKMFDNIELASKDSGVGVVDIYSILDCKTSVINGYRFKSIENKVMIERTRMSDGDIKQFDTIKRASQSSKIKISEIRDILASKIASLKGYTFKEVGATNKEAEVVDVPKDDAVDGPMTIHSVDELVEMVPEEAFDCKALVITEQSSVSNNFLNAIYGALTKGGKHTILFRRSMGEVHIDGKMLIKVVCERKLARAAKDYKDRFHRIFIYKP